MRTKTYLLAVYSLAAMLALSRCGHGTDPSQAANDPAAPAQGQSQSQSQGGGSQPPAPPVTALFTPGVPNVTFYGSTWCYTDNINTTWQPSTNTTILTSTDPNVDPYFYFVSFTWGGQSTFAGKQCVYHFHNQADGGSYGLACTSNVAFNDTNNKLLIPGWTITTNVVTFDNGQGFGCNYVFTKN